MVDWIKAQVECCGHVCMSVRACVCVCLCVCVVYLYGGEFCLSSTEQELTSKLSQETDSTLTPQIA